MKAEAPPGSLTRRSALVVGLGVALHASPHRASAASAPTSIRIADDRPGRLISPLIYGSNEIGVMDGGKPSAELDRTAGVTARRLGGDLMTAYNWTNNATNAGKNHLQSNGPFLLEALQIPRADWGRPAAVIEAMHDASLAMGAKSLVTLPVAGFVAADLSGPVNETEAAPSPRFVPVRWTGQTHAGDPVDTRIADIPHLLARLIARYGRADSPRGIHAYALDNEPAIWFQTHPRLFRERATIGTFIEKSIAAARAIKAADPAAKVFGPASWGATEMVSFQNAPDWLQYQRYGSFLAAYLDAFRVASEQHGLRLLDTLDVHWYPFNRQGKLFRTESPDLDRALLDAPRSLTEPGFFEDSWVPSALRGGGREGLGLPILPSLERLVARRFPGTGIAVTEFNYGGAGRLAAALALADVLGRFGASGVLFATHWGSLEGWLAQAYRLFRMSDASGGAFAGRTVPLPTLASPSISAYAAVDDRAVRVILINKSDKPDVVELTTASGRRLSPDVIGFDAEQTQTGPVRTDAHPLETGWRIALPARSARRYRLV